MAAILLLGVLVRWPGQALFVPQRYIGIGLVISVHAIELLAFSPPQVLYSDENKVNMPLQ